MIINHSARVAVIHFLFMLRQLNIRKPSHKITDEVVDGFLLYAYGWKS
jgi:hypothetical protein